MEEWERTSSVTEEWERLFRMDLYRPRDDFDIGVHPESFRGKVLAYMDALDDVRIRIEALLWYQRVPIKVYMRLRGIKL